MRLLEGTPFDRPPHCEICDLPETECRCRTHPFHLRAPQLQTARLALEKRAKGKQVVVVRGLKPDETDLEGLAAYLKAACGAGGAVKEATIEIQGSAVERARTALAQLGYRVKG